MFKLIKLFIKFIFFVIFVAIALVVAGNYQLIRSSAGFHVIERNKWGFSDFYVNTTDWSPLDFTKNPRISSELFSDKFQAIFSDTKTSVQKWWNDVSSDEKVPELKQIKKEFDSALAHLNQMLKDNKLTIDKYKKKLKTLKKDTEKKINKVMEALRE